MRLFADSDTIEITWGAECRSQITSAKTQSSHPRKDTQYLVERLAPRSRDQVVIFGGQLLQLIGAIAVIYVVLHFLFKYW